VVLGAGLLASDTVTFELGPAGRGADGAPDGARAEQAGL
jgi:hypothetical protein